MNIHEIRDKESLIEYIQQGNKVKYIFFWGHQPSRDGRITNTCFSQWYAASFQSDDIDYQTAEHYMMAEKARLFNSPEILDQILKSKHPGAAKKLGREIQNFSETQWLQKRFEIVVKGNVLKFSQNDALRQYLLSTGNRILVEASPIDKIWGIGLAANDANVSHPKRWPGLNLLGFALMEARQMILDGTE